jgi:succinylglutamate desuccinylase
MIWDKKTKKRILGLYGDFLSEKLLIIVAGIHGNEQSGILAIQQVFDHLKKMNFPVKGCILALKGNVKAIEENKRFIDKDLNRLWSEEQIDFVRETPLEALKTNEDKEQKELLYILEQFTEHREAHTPFLFLDLHTTSAEGGLFTIVNGNDLSVAMAQKLEVPLILHLDKVIKNTTLGIFSKKQFSAIAFEAGQHTHPESVKRIEAAIYILLHEMDIINFSTEFICENRKILSQAALSLPKLTEFAYKHTINPEDHFEMLPGFNNFDKIVKGQPLAKDKNGPIYASIDGYILMPLYQKQGEDGFFIIQ